MNYPSFLKLAASIGLFTLLSSCSHTEKTTLPNPEIKEGTTRLSGKVKDYHRKDKEKKPLIYLRVSYPITGETVNYQTSLEAEGSFCFAEIPIECNTIGFITSDIFNWTAVGVGLISGDEEMQVEISYNENRHIQVRQATNSVLSTSDQLVYSDELTVKFLSPAETYKKSYDMNPEDYCQYTMYKMDKQIKFALDGASLSTTAENVITNEFKLLYLVKAFLDYKESVSLNYSYFNTEEEPDDFTPQEPDKTYYSFLKDFNLNSPQYLYTMNYPEVLETILRNDTLGIPSIGETPVAQWMKEVKTMMASLVGFDKGLFYDLLAANSYALQFNDATRPLSNRQKENITNYFTGKKKEFAKILLKKNVEIEKIA
ncbi:MAG: hypothetical protein LBH19_11135, partial [Dysgonamonadaceae bacterium]|nr:hypothetical protein [Dysgonamonadaceae bacterium]